jgi:BirA family transcriptional regulator, biotin operon repressor / biotin---[acetyl-CoA-carboxylase] ligase
MGLPDHFRESGGGSGAGFEPPAGWHSVAAPAASWTVWHVRVTGSTNTDLIDAAAAGAPHRTVLVTDHQTAGRGRLDRRWDAPAGANLLVSILFREVPDPPVALTHRVGLAVVDAVRDVAGMAASLKWPNDVLLDGRKLAGILAQRVPDGPVVVGLGLNVGWAPDGSARLDIGATPGTMLAGVLTAYDALPDDITHRYRDALSTLGAAVRVELPNGSLEGRAVDVEADGRLVVLDDCAITHRIDVGDVVHLRSVEG